MKLTRKKAIELCIELWTWLAKTGKSKYDWPGWETYGYFIENDCWFCEYGSRQEKRYLSNKTCCEYCPLFATFGENGCYNPECAYKKWDFAQTPRTRKKYAKLFLEQIKKCK